MFKEMRRKNRELSEEEARELLKGGDYGILSTTGENGYAYGIPLNYACVENAIYFHCALEGAKLDNIAYNNKVSFCVVGKTAPLPEKFSYSFESVVAFGEARKVEGEEKYKALLALVEKYSGAYMEKGKDYINHDAPKTAVFKISIEHITGKARR